MLTHPVVEKTGAGNNGVAAGMCWWCWFIVMIKILVPGSRSGNGSAGSWEFVVNVQRLF
jgi:hypothetical protein